MLLQFLRRVIPLPENMVVILRQCRARRWRCPYMDWSRQLLIKMQWSKYNFSALWNILGHVSDEPVPGQHIRLFCLSGKRENWWRYTITCVFCANRSSYTRHHIFTVLTNGKSTWHNIRHWRRRQGDWNCFKSTGDIQKRRSLFLHQGHAFTKCLLLLYW